MLYIALMLMPNDERQFIVDMYRRTEVRLIKYAFSLSRDVDWARDAVQRVFEYMISGPGKFRAMTEAQWMGYALTMIKTDHTRDMKREGTLDDLDEHADTLASGLGSAEDEVIRRFESDALRRAVMRLPDNQREALRLKHALGLSHAEVAARMGISASRSQNLVAIAIKRMRELLKDEVIG